MGCLERAFTHCLFLQGTIVLELLEQVRAMVGSGDGAPLAAVVVPLGGGGMLSGIAMAVKVRHCIVCGSLLLPLPLPHLSCTANPALSLYSLNSFANMTCPHPQPPPASRCAFRWQSMYPDMLVVGAEPRNASDAFRSKQQGEVGLGWWWPKPCSLNRHLGSFLQLISPYCTPICNLTVLNLCSVVRHLQLLDHGDIKPDTIADGLRTTLGK